MRICCKSVLCVAQVRVVRTALQGQQPLQWCSEGQVLHEPRCRTLCQRRQVAFRVAGVSPAGLLDCAWLSVPHSLLRNMGVRPETCGARVLKHAGPADCQQIPPSQGPTQPLGRQQPKRRQRAPQQLPLACG